MPQKTAIVILNWNGKELLERFLPSVIKFKDDNSEIIIADNYSTDDSVSFLKATYPQLRLILNDKNYGFAEGYNLALKQIETEYYILLNSDIEVTANWAKGIIDFMEQNPDVAVCQPRIRSYREPELFEYAGACGGYIDKLGYPFCRGRLFQSIEKDHGQYNDIREIFWASGACFFIRAKLFHQAGGFDGDFFAHMEEIDLCWRLKNMGHRVFVYPDSIIYHVGGATLDKMSPRKTFLNFRNNLSLIYKNIPGDKLHSVLFKRVFLDMLAAFSFIFSGGFRHFGAVISAYYAFYKSLKKIRYKRKAIPHHMSVAFIVNLL